MSFFFIAVTVISAFVCGSAATQYWMLWMLSRWNAVIPGAKYKLPDGTAIQVLEVTDWVVRYQTIQDRDSPYSVDHVSSSFSTDRWTFQVLASPIVVERRQKDLLTILSDLSDEDWSRNEKLLTQCLQDERERRRDCLERVEARLEVEKLTGATLRRRIPEVPWGDMRAVARNVGPARAQDWDDITQPGPRE